MISLAEIQAAERRFQAQLDADLQGAVAEYQRRFGNVLDRDNARELFAEYAASRESRQTLGAATYRPAGALIERIYRQEVAKPDPAGGNLVVFNAGGPGVGKSTGLQGTALDAFLVMDGTLSNYAKSRAHIWMAFDHGKEAGINFIQRPYEEALQNIIERAVDPNNGRVVTAAMAALGLILARENVLRLAQEFADDPRLAISLTDNTGNLPKATTLDELRAQTSESLDDLRQRAQTFVDGYFHEYAPGNPVLGEELRQRILTPLGQGENGPRTGSGNRQP